MAQTPEGRVKSKVKKILDSKGHDLFYYMPVQNGMGVVGIPDIVGCYKGKFIAIETKKPNKNPTTVEQRMKKCTPNQLNRLNEIVAAEGYAIVCDDPEQVTDLLNRIDTEVDNA
jgi:hypothetical protein